MKELGIDTLNNEKVIIARERLNRPIDEIRDNTNKYEIKEYSKDCPFCRGNEKYIEVDSQVSKK